MLGVVDSQMVDVENVEEQVVGLGVHAVEVEPEEVLTGEMLFDGLAGGRGCRPVEGQGAVHAPSLPPGTDGGRDGRIYPLGPA